MNIATQVVHLKHCTVVSEQPSVELKFKGVVYTLTFESDEFSARNGVVVTCLSGEPVASDVLLWLSVYFGEDFIEPYPQEDTRYSSNRGEFELQPDNLAAFLRAAEKMPPKNYPRWKAQLIENALAYYSVGLRSGVNLMPLTIGFFGLSIECVGNTRQTKQTKYYTLGEKRVSHLINARLARRKRSVRYRDDTKLVQKRLNEDLTIVHLLRNAYYGHSFSHRRKDRVELTEVLREHYERSGINPSVAALSFSERRLDDCIQVAAPQLYKIGMRVSRVAIFMLIGIYPSIPTASHDFRLFGPMGYGKPRKYRGMSLTPLEPSSEDSE